MTGTPRIASNSTSQAPAVRAAAARRTADPLRVRLVAGFSELGDEVNPLIEAAGGVPFRRLEWLRAWSSTLGRAQRPALFVAETPAGEVVGFAPFAYSRNLVHGRRLVLMGGGRAASDHVGMTSRPGWEGRTAAALADSIDRLTAAQRIDLIELEGVSENDRATADLVARLSERGYGVHAQELGGSWAVELPAGWDQFERSIPKKFRRKLTKASRRLASGAIGVRSIRDPQALRDAWPTFVELHTARRRALNDGGCFAVPGFSDFLLEALTGFAASQRASLLIASCEGQPFGAVVLIESDDASYLYQSGFDPTFADLEPGHLMIVLALRQAIAGGRRRFDFLRGDEPYKARWNTVRTALRRYRLVPPRPAARLRDAAWRLARATRDRLCRGPAAALVDERDGGEAE